MSKTDRRLIPLLAFALATTAPTKAQDPDPTVEQRVQTVLAEHLNGDPKAALKELDALLASKPGQAGPILAARYRVLRQTGRNDEAADALDRLAKIDAKWRQFAITEGAKLRKLRPDLQVPTSPIPERLRELVYKMIEAGKGWDDAQQLLTQIGSPAVPAILEVFGTMDLWQQGVAMDTLASIDDSQVRAWFATVFEDGGDEVLRGMVLQRLFRIGDKTRRQVAMAGAQCDSESIRRDALGYLSGPVPTELIPAVLEWSSSVEASDDPSTVDRALDLLVACPGNARPVEAEILRLLPRASLTTSSVSRGTATTMVTTVAAAAPATGFLTDEGLTLDQVVNRALAITTGRTSLNQFDKSIDSADPDGTLGLRPALWARMGTNWRKALGQQFLSWAQENDQDEFALQILADPMAGTMLWTMAELDLRRQSKEAVREFLRTRQYEYSNAIRDILEDVRQFGWTGLAPDVTPLLDATDGAILSQARRMLTTLAPTRLLDHANDRGIASDPSYAVRSAEPRHMSVVLATFEWGVRRRDSAILGDASFALGRLLEPADVDSIERLVRLTTLREAKDWGGAISSVGESLQNRLTPEAVTRILSIDGLPDRIIALALPVARTEDATRLAEIARASATSDDVVRLLVLALSDLDPKAAETLISDLIARDSDAMKYAGILSPGSASFWQKIVDTRWDAPAMWSAIASGAWVHEPIDELILEAFTSDEPPGFLEQPMLRFLRSLERERAVIACRKVVANALARDPIEDSDAHRSDLQIAIQWLGKQDADQVIQDLGPILDPNSTLSHSIHATAIGSVAQTYDPRVVPLLTEMLRSPQKSVREAADAALERLATYYEAQNSWAERFKKLGIQPTNQPLPTTPGPAGPGRKRNGR